MTGFELGRFRLKQGVTEADLLAAARRMEDGHLRRQEGFASHHLVALDDGVYFDIVFAATRDAAERICASWRGQAECEAFLALIEPLSMEFGHVLTEARAA